MSDLDQQILNLITAKPGLKAKDVAKQLGIDRKLVNSALYGRLKGKVRQDKSYQWYATKVSETDKRGEGQSKRLNTPLARLSRYYLECLSQDDLGGVSDFAESKYGDPKYIELDTLPTFDKAGAGPFDSEAAQQLLTRIRRDRNRQTLFLGYPVRLNLIRSKKGWEGFMVEPLLLFPFQEPENRYGVPTLADDMPVINFRALRSLTNVGETGLMEEAIQLSEELGLGNVGADQPELDELLARLREIRQDWDWKEAIDPNSLSQGDPLSNQKNQGIFNRAILIAAERSPFTKGLESELGSLQTVEENDYRNTAVGAWLSGQTFESPPPDQKPLLVAFTLNSVQRQAVRQALSNQLTIITGPPGTGKSQVVMSILMNAAWQGKTVLFASKNNKAVDVVETRVNALGPRPVLLRLGANEYQSRLAEYLISLLAATATADDRERYRECEAIHVKLQHLSEALDAKITGLIDLRNEVDRLEQQVEEIRHDLGKEVFGRIREIDHENLKQASWKLHSTIEMADRKKCSLGVRILWPLIRKGRFDRLNIEAAAFRHLSDLIALPIPKNNPDSLTIDEWIQYGNQLKIQVDRIASVQQYFSKLSELNQATALEDLTRDRKKITEELASNSELLWHAWLRLQPTRMTSEQRKLLGDYSAILQMIVSTSGQSQKLGRDIFRRYYQLFPQIVSILSCWAVTSLSTRGRVPFLPNFFDLLVIDEASQCDIASALPLLFRARSVVVIGDPKQLRHISTLSKSQDQQLLSKHGLLDDLPGWAYSTRSLFDLASSLCRSEDIIALRDHHRSHADIIEFSNEAFYEGRLRVATRYDRLRRPRYDEPAIRWVDIQGKCVRPGAGGAFNEEEATAVVREMERLLSQDYRGSIGVVSPFRAQANRIRDLVNSRDSLASRLIGLDFLADTVHKFQGDERDIIIFSPVVSPGVTEGALGFLRSNPNLFNVAITRARAALIVVGNKTAALNSKVDYLARFVEYTDHIRTNDYKSKIPVTADFGPAYPLVSNPERVSEWEHMVYRALYSAGIRAIPQYAVEKYVLDLAVILPQRRLNIEIDGERYHRNWDGELCRRDQIRNQRLMELGWDVMRFWVYQVRDDLETCVTRVQKWLKG